MDQGPLTLRSLILLMLTSFPYLYVTSSTAYCAIFARGRRVGQRSKEGSPKEANLLKLFG